MGRQRIYADDTERQRSWRERLKSQAAGQMTTRPAAKAKRAPSRPARLAAILATVEVLQGEYEQWLDALPDSLAESQLAERLTETIDQFQAVTDLLADIDPPRGFGRD